MMNFVNRRGEKELNERLIGSQGRDMEECESLNIYFRNHPPRRYVAPHREGKSRGNSSPLQSLSREFVRQQTAE